MAQVTYTGTTVAQNFGSQPIGSASAATTFSFSVAAGTTVGSIEVVTQGAPNLDFTRATGSACAAATYTSAATCTVNVTFTPKTAGARRGAVVFFSASGNAGTVLGSVLIYGVGTGPQAVRLLVFPGRRSGWPAARPSYSAQEGIPGPLATTPVE